MSIKKHSEFKPTNKVTLAFGKPGAGHIEWAVKDACKQPEAKVLVLVSSSSAHLDRSWGDFDYTDPITTNEALKATMVEARKEGYNTIVWLGFNAYKQRYIIGLGDGITQAEWGAAWRKIFLDFETVRDGLDIYLTSEIELDPETNTLVSDINGGLMRILKPHLTHFMYVAVSADGKRLYQPDGVKAMAFLAGSKAEDDPDDNDEPRTSALKKRRI